MADASRHDHHRKADGVICLKHGETQVATLRRAYGATFAIGFASTDSLATVLRTMDQRSLTRLAEDHQAGLLEEKIKLASGANGVKWRR